MSKTLLRRLAAPECVTAICLALSSEAHGQSVAQYNYDALGRLTDSQDGVQATASYQYDPADNRKTTVMANQFAQSWVETSSSIGHKTGRQDNGEWSASVYDPVDHLSYGHYTQNVPAGSRVAAFRMLVDNNNADNLGVVRLDVWDSTVGAELAVRQVTRTEWKAANAYQVFEVPFQLDAGSAAHGLEFRVYYLATSYVRVSRVGYR